MTPNSKLWYFENFNFLDALSDSVKYEIGAMAGMRKASKNQVIYFPGDDSNNIYFLKEGRVKISNVNDEGKEMILALLGPGEMFGELAVAGQDTRDHIAEATEETVICVLNQEELSKLIEENPILHREITKLIGDRYRKIQARLESLVFKSAPQRIRHFIKDMVDEFGRSVGTEREVKLNLTHQDIANLTTTTRQTVTLVLRELEKRDIILYDRKRILVRDYDALTNPESAK